MLDQKYTGVVELGEGEIEHVASIVGMDAAQCHVAFQRSDRAKEALATILESDGVEAAALKELERELKLAAIDSPPEP